MKTQPKFTGFMAESFLSAKVEKGLIGRSSIERGHLLSASQFLFRTGAILGCAFRDQFEVFVAPFFAERDDAETIDWIRQQGHRVREVAEQADTVSELFIIDLMRIREPALPASAWPQWWSSMSTSGKKLRFDQSSMEWVVLSGARGSGFGAEFPELTGQLYAKETQEYPPIFSGEEAMVKTFADLCAEFYPELLDPLGLNTPVPATGVD